MSTQSLPSLRDETASSNGSEPPIPRIIHFTIPKNATPEQLANIENARKLHPGWEIKVWQDPLDPSPFRLSKYWGKANSGAQLADLIRLEVVYQHGGFYVDSDFDIHRNLDPLRVYPFLIASEDGLALTQAFFAAAPNSPPLAHLIDKLDRQEVDWKLPPDVTTGPAFFARELKWRDDVTVLPRATLYPYNHNERARKDHLWTYATHLWSFTWGSVTGYHKPLRPLVRYLRMRRKELQTRWKTDLRYFFTRLRLGFRTGGDQSFSASGTICAQTVHGLKIFLHGEDVSITPQIALNGTYEFREERFINRVVDRGDWVIDVGANVGIMTLVAAQKVRPCGRVFAYEPNPLVANLLKKSLVLNWFHDRVVLREKGIGSRPGRLQLRFSKGLLGGATLASEDPQASFDGAVSLVSDEESIDVEVTTLDADFPVDLPIRLLKIDAEGFEHEVLRGARRLFEQQCVDILMMECMQEISGNNWDDLLVEVKKLMDIGYKPHLLTGSSRLEEINWRKILASDRERNIVFVSRHALSTIG